MKKKRRPVTGNYTRPFTNDAMRMTVEAFKINVEMGFFMDYDGFGHAVKGELEDTDTGILPSKLHRIPLDADGVHWYNR